ncbi:MAG: phosphatidylserine/phosphatidylglycerophosphate/cardiolipin synthase family protein [Bacteroidales bacterium]|nr:phosphatidylserine/phosphatidylglycerophosphate/cardiolipin synthase family protein [Bacteroidales bacterium]MCF8405649.1 phosphatidylserine/phosphatidylglycerophosphate/cardiolipin synthase family protein [Bacteroidales bacterium]
MKGNSSILSTYKLFHDPLKYYNAMLDDIARAKKYIYLETYRFNNDVIGIKFRDALTKKSSEGVEIKLLMDSWGTSLPSNFFKKMLENGAEVRYFRKLKYVWNFFTRNHKRNHRKLIVIDDEISYIGSANLTDYSLNWRESILRIQADLSVAFRKVFLKHFEIYNKYSFEQGMQIRKVVYGQFEILQDVPSLTRQRIRKRYIELIKTTTSKIVIVTPYFLPSFFLRKALADAAERGVDVQIIMPKNSDVGLIDVLRNRFLGPLSQHGVHLLFYMPHNLHAKMLLVDDEYFSIGSPNFDYRSFRFQHEIVLIGKEKQITEQVKEYIDETLENSEPFNYDEWKNRSSIQRFFEWLILPFRHLL